jgi:hypothetical protein
MDGAPYRAWKYRNVLRNNHEDFDMQRMFSTLGQWLRQSMLVLGLVSLLSLSGLAIPAASYAGPYQANDSGITKINRDSVNKQSVEERESAYETMTEATQKPDGLEEEYEKNLEAYEEQQPGQNILEGAKNLIDRVTDNNS